MKRYSTIKKAFALTSEEIDAVSARISGLPEHVCGRRESLRVRLATEEILILWQEMLGEQTHCTLWCGVRFGQWSIKLSATGPCIDPNTYKAESDLDAAGNVILERLGLTPIFRYEKGVNLVTIQLPRKERNQLVWLGMAAALAVVLGFASLSLPHGVRTGLLDGIVTPVFQALLGALIGVAMPMMFLSVCSSIVGIGDIAVLGGIGKRFLWCFLTIPFICTAGAVLSVLWLFPVSAGSSGGKGAFEAVFSMLLDIVPRNIIAPFLDGNALQIIFLGICFGISLLALGERGRLASEVMGQFERAVTLLMGALSRLLPLLVFISIFSLIASKTYTQFGGVALMLMLCLVLSLITMLVFTAVICLRLHVPVKIIIAKMLPAFLVALSTASSGAALPLWLETCEKRLGLESKLSRFAVPLGQVLFKPTAAICFAMSALCFGHSYGVAITPAWLILCIVVSGIVSIAAPPVPGSAQMCHSILFLQLGIPAEGLTLAMAAASLWDYIATASFSWCQIALISLVADELGMLDKSVLYAPTAQLKS